MASEQSETEFDVRRDDGGWIPLSDGSRLAMRVWRPEVDEAVPVILEYLPYRQGDGTWPRDEPIARWFAAHGYAYVRVDLRGTGNSDGVITDEYTRQEHDDGLEVIAWLAEQPWSTGRVGMIGISWGGFNGLQLAARRPPALGAVISMCSTDDRYADDVHYYGGGILAWDMLPWSSVMFAMNALPPDPRVVGDGWRDMWLTRLERTPPFSLEWLRHQRRDDYWRHGSVCEEYAAIDCPVYVVGGWADGYTNAIPRLMAALPGTRRGLIGPWPHAWPHNADQGPRIGFLTQCLRWFDRWLRGTDNGVDDEPLLTAWMQDPLAPDQQATDRKGRWVQEEQWPPPSVRPRTLYLGDERNLTTHRPDTSTAVTHAGFQRHGLLAGTWCPYGPAADFPPDQREEDALCLTFDGPALTERLELLGHPRMQLRLWADQPDALVVARLCSVAPDGTSLLLSRGALNLTHRDGHAEPRPVVPGDPMDVTLTLDALGQAVAPGHRLRLALSTTYWPWLWPSPRPVTLTVELGPDSHLELPVREGPAVELPAPTFGGPEQVHRLDRELEETDAFHVVERDLVTGEVTLRINQDGDSVTRLPDGVTMSVTNRDSYRVREGEPLSATVTCERRRRWSVDDIEVSIVTRSSLTSTLTAFDLTEHIEVREGDHEVFRRTWEERIPRDGV